MSNITRQNTLFVSEDWKRVYQVLQNVDFSAYDQDSIRSAIIENIRTTYPDEFNDWIGSSEFVIKLDTISFLASTLAYRIDVNSRENFLSVAERRDSLLKLAYNIAYSVSRNKANFGEFKVTSISTNQNLLDLDENPISGEVFWNDPSDPDWMSKWVTIMDAALDAKTKFGRPLRQYRNGVNISSLYRLNSPSPANGVYKFNARTSAGNLPFEIINVLLEEDTGIYNEITPDRFNAFHILYKNDGLGAGSINTGFFLPFKQGTLNFLDVVFSERIPMNSVDVEVPNINDSDIFVTRINADGDVLESWSQVQTASNETLAYNPSLKDSNIFEVITKNNNTVTVQFGDGKFGAIPMGQFRIWYRTSFNGNSILRTNDIDDNTLSIPYVSDGQLYRLRIKYNLMEYASNGSPSESNEDIRTRANKVFYTQNRMVNAEDYNSFVYSDPSIIKVKAVNRTFSGHGRSVPLRDPSGTYNNVNKIASDGRIFKENTTKSIKAIYNQSIESLSTFINQYIKPLIAQEDKQILYYNQYPKFKIEAVTYIQTSSINNRSVGKFDTPITQGNLTKAIPNSILFFRNGETARVDYISQNTNGTLSNSVFLKRPVSFTSENVIEVMPPMKRSFTEVEETELSERLIQRKSFGIRWDTETLSWKTIATENLNHNAFSLTNTGDKSGSALDSSWLIKLDYSIGTNGQDEWTITDRGLSIAFESEQEIEFIHVNDKPIIDGKTGKKLRDSVILLKTNEKKDSLERRGLKSSIGTDPYTGQMVIIGDGVQKVFPLDVDKIDDNSIFFLVDNVPTLLSNWFIDRSTGAPVLKFEDAVPNGQFITILFDPRRTIATPLRKDYMGDNNQFTYSLSQKNVRVDNTFVFVATKLKSPFDDYTTFNASTESRIKFNQAPGEGQPITINYLVNGSPAFASFNYTSDGLETNYPLIMETNYVMVFVDGLRVTNFTLEDSVEDSYEIIFDTAPEEGKSIHIKALIYDNTFRVDEVSYTATLGQNRFEPPAMANNAGTIRTMVWVNGSYQHDFSYDDGIDDIILSAPLSGGEKVVVTNLSVTGTLNEGYDIVGRSAVRTEPLYLENEITYLVHDRLRHNDGYSNSKGILITNIDEDMNGEIDRPFEFFDFVISDGLSDLVLWRKVTENGFDVWTPISGKTTPRGLYTTVNDKRTIGQPLLFEDNLGDIFYDTLEDEWLIAGINEWELAPVQSDFKKAIGRSGIEFRWLHYASDQFRIDPSASNIIDIFVLTTDYDNSIRQAVRNNTPIPLPQTSNQLRNRYRELQAFKMISDSIVWHPARYKMLFGPNSVPEVRAKFLVVKSPASVIPDNDLKIRVLNAIDQYFDISLWEFGEKFYFTELCSFIHSQLAPNIQTIVPVSVSGASFGRLFQIRSEPDELFINTATVNEIEVVDSLTDKRLNIT